MLTCRSDYAAKSICGRGSLQYIHMCPPKYQCNVFFYGQESEAQALYIVLHLVIEHP